MNCNKSWAEGGVLRFFEGFGKQAKEKEGKRRPLDASFWPLRLASGQHGGHLSFQSGVDFFLAAASVDDLELKLGLEAHEVLLNEVLVFEKAVEHIAGKPQVHAAFPIVQRVVFGEGSADKLFRRNVEIKDGVRHQCDSIKIFDPVFFLPADDVAHHKRVNVSVGQHHKAGLQGGNNGVFGLVGKVGGVKQAHGSVAENVAFFRSLQFFADEAGTFQAHLNGAVSGGFQPLNEPLDLRGSARAVRSFDDDELAGERMDVDAGDAVPVKLLGSRRRHQNLLRHGRRIRHALTNRD